jgi:HTH-type transcriptional regulator, transcriptional repressor of NAD biosynthesis genes
MAIKVCLFGPESVGKTTASHALAAKHPGAIVVPEVARDMVFDSDFTLEDIERIAEAQTAAVMNADRSPADLVICDTDVITTGLYSQIYLGSIPESVTALESAVKYDLYLLFDIDVPWVADGLRDLGDRRQEIHAMFKAALDERGIEYVEVRGDWDARTRIIEDAVNGILGRHV